MSIDATTKINKTLNKKLYRLRLNENDLFRLANILEPYVNALGSKLDIYIVTGDGEDILETTDKSFFLSLTMPNNIQSVSMKCYDKSFVPSLTVEFGSASRQKWYDYGTAEVSISGSDPNLVAGTYREILRELEPRQLWDKNIFYFLDTLLGYVLISLLSAFAMYSAFDFILRSIAKILPEFWGSSIHNLLVIVGLIFVLVTLLASGVPITHALKRAFPAVEFSGKLTDPSHIFRTRLKWITSFILLPIGLNIIASFLFERLR